MKTSFEEFFPTVDNTRSAVSLKSVLSGIKQIGMDPVTYVKKHSILPYYKLFLETEEYYEACFKTLYGQKSCTHILERNHHSLTHFNGNKLFYCPECIKENPDYRSIRIHHQIPGVHVCSKHHCYLKVIGIKPHRLLLNFRTWDMGVEQCEEGSLLEQIANDVEFILQVQPDYDIIRLRAIIASSISKLKPEVIEEKMESFYMHLPEEYAMYKQYADYQRFITNTMVGAVDPVEYLLLMHCLFGGIEKFLKERFIVLHKKTF